MGGGSELRGGAGRRGKPIPVVRACQGPGTQSCRRQSKLQNSSESGQERRRAFSQNFGHRLPLVTPPHQGADNQKKLDTNQEKPRNPDTDSAPELAPSRTQRQRQTRASLFCGAGFQERWGQTGGLPRLFYEMCSTKHHRMTPVAKPGSTPSHCTVEKVGDCCALETSMAPCCLQHPVHPPYYAIQGVRCEVPRGLFHSHHGPTSPPSPPSPATYTLRFSSPLWSLCPLGP